jgi:phosphate transport system substrate-binding protein
MKKILGIVVAVIGIFCSSCSYDLNSESATSGKLKIGVDESYSLMMDSQIYTFEALYPYAKVAPRYRPEADVISDLLADTIQAAIICRDLTDAEKKMFESKHRIVTTTKIATDAIAFIVNPENPDTAFSLIQLKAIFAGTDTTWSQLDKNNKNGAIRVVFDNTKSCNARFVSENLLDKKPFPSSCFSVKTNAEVIDYVNKNKNAIGVISVSWISDFHDKTSQEFLSKIKVVGLSERTEPAGPADYKKPYQAWIYEKTYPLRRDVYYVKTGLEGTLGSGFAAFIAGEKGQLIIHQMGMVAATAPIRAVHISTE